MSRAFHGTHTSLTHLFEVNATGAEGHVGDKLVGQGDYSVVVGSNESRGDDGAHEGFTSV